jgi:hypothetical protein
MLSKCCFFAIFIHEKYMAVFEKAASAKHMAWIDCVCIN